MRPLAATVVIIAGRFGPGRSAAPLVTRISSRKAEIAAVTEAAPIDSAWVAAAAACWSETRETKTLGSTQKPDTETAPSDSFNNDEKAGVCASTLFISSGIRSGSSRTTGSCKAD